MIKYLLMNLKMILGKKSWANYDTVVVQIYPASCGIARLYVFGGRLMQSFRHTNN
jgi:hypothetical protein